MNFNSYRVEWFANNQGTRYELVDALNAVAANQIIEAKYGGLKNFKIISTVPYSNHNRYDDTNLQVEAPKFEYYPTNNSGRTDFCAEIASVIAGVGGLIAFIGFATIMSGGIILVGIGGLIFYLAVTYG